MSYPIYREDLYNLKNKILTQNNHIVEYISYQILKQAEMCNSYLVISTDKFNNDFQIEQILIKLKERFPDTYFVFNKSLKSISIDWTYNQNDITYSYFS